MAGLLCKIWFLIDKDDWWSKLAEVLVGFEDSAILNPPTDCNFQSSISVLIVDVYLESVSGVLLPLHGCRANPDHLDNIYNHVGSAFEYVL